MDDCPFQSVAQTFVMTKGRMGIGRVIPFPIT
jgi:hypothetical protein